MGRSGLRVLASLGTGLLAASCQGSSSSASMDVSAFLQQELEPRHGTTPQNSFTLQLPQELRQSGPGSWDNAFGRPPFFLIVGVSDDALPISLDAAANTPGGLESGYLMRVDPRQNGIAVVRASGDTTKIEARVWKTWDQTTLRCDVLAIQGFQPLGPDSIRIGGFLERICDSLELR